MKTKKDVSHYKSVMMAFNLGRVQLTKKVQGKIEVYDPKVKK